MGPDEWRDPNWHQDPKYHHDPNYDRTHVEAILGPYPELIARLEHEIALGYGRGVAGPGDAENPEYLRRVVREHLWLTEGPGDQPDPELERRCQEAASIWPPVAAERASRLKNPFWRADEDSKWLIAEMYDPVHLERYARVRKEGATNPFSENNLRWRQAMNVLNSGGRMNMELVEKATGKTTDLGDVDLPPGTAAADN
jgi:hypothetical protein